MILPFSTQWPERMGELAGKPTFFLDKIWIGIFENKMSGMFGWQTVWNNYNARFCRGWDYQPRPLPYNTVGKTHSIRADLHERWKAGMDIHAVINNRSKNVFQ